MGLSAISEAERRMLPRRILIANRGEIACRVIAACHELDIEAVAVYSDADAGALHVRLADHAVPLGGATAAESYLRGDRIIAAAREAGAAAVHPGYGFLSENAAFAAACGGAGLTFIGPPAAAMRVLGNKIAAKQVAERAGVPILPDYRGEDQRPATLAREAERIGYPALIKAAAGGGGRGMRVVRHADELADAAAAAAREAGSAFGDATIFLERYVARPRHIEVQVLADTQGTVLAIGERECSVQRRHQKVVEEAPSPAVDPSLRRALYAAAVTLARAAAYVNAGTVEFLLDRDGHFYFLEMNTRLQVEHPVTELVSGIDLVAAQIRIAAGEPLPWAQEDIALRGHAIEVRLYAEDPAHGFAPATGTLRRVSLPHLPGVRIDAGIQTGDTVGLHYDPLLAKVIAHGETRGAALARLRGALDRCEVWGVTTNRAYLRRILDHPAFVAADLSTGFLEEHEQDLLPTEAAPDPLDWIAAAVAFAARRPDEAAGASAWTDVRPWRHSSTGVTIYLQEDGDQRRAITVRPLGHDRWAARLDDREQVAVTTRRDGALHISHEGTTATHRALIDDTVVLLVNEARAFSFSFTYAPAPSSDGAADARGDRAGLRVPMPGIVVKVHVREGERVAENQPLLVLEAMKMEHLITAPRAGIVQRLPFKLGALAPANAVLVELEET